MSGILNLLGLGSRANTPGPQSLASRIQTAIEGRPLPVGAGQNRYAGNIIWYGDYKAVPVTTGGKGGGGTGKGSNGEYNYSSSFIISLGEELAATNPVKSISNGNQYDFFYTPSADIVAALTARGITITHGNTYGATFLAGAYTQAPWAYMTSHHVDQALSYRGESQACFPNLGLGTSPALPNFNFEVLWNINTDIAAFGPDANPADWVAAFLSNADWGAGFPAVLLDGFDDYRLWARAAGLLISPVLDGQDAGNSHLADIMTGTVAEFVWSNGVLKVVPHTDSGVTGNGFTYAPDTTPVYDLGPLDLLPVTHGPDTGNTPALCKVSRIDPTTVPNQLSMEYLPRAGLYNPATIRDQDDALIAAARALRPADTLQFHFFCADDAANRSLALQLQRSKVMRQFFFTLPPQFALLDAMDIVTLTVPSRRLSKQPVRILEIVEDDTGALQFTAEEFMGAVTAPLYARQAPLGAGRNANVSPGSINAPVLFETPDAYSAGLKIFAAVSGADTALYGGCNIWVATEAGGTYQQVAQMQGPSRMGVLTAPLPSIAAAVSGLTIDSTNPLGVDLAESLGTLASGSLADMTALNTACYADGELVAYQNATLVSGNAYSLAPLVRGAFGSTIADHATGTPFARLDNLVAAIPYTQDRIGGTLYIKFQAFNIYGGGVQSLADIAPVAYVIKGTALSSPLPDVQNLRATYVDSTSAITWDEVSDFRTPFYEVRRGAAWDAAQTLGVVAHPPFVTVGDGNYLVKARAEPVAGLIVYSTNAQAIDLEGTVLPDNIVATYDEPGTGWTGTITGPGAIVGSNFVTTATGVVTYYEVPSGHIFDVLYPRPTRINAAWQAQGVPIGDNILTNPDFLGTADLFGSAATRNIDSWVEIFVSGTAADVYGAPDVYALPDVYAGTGGWVKFAPGVYFGQNFRARIALVSYDPATQAVATAFSYSADVETRVDHLTSEAIGTSGLTLSFTPDGSGSAVAFNGGPNGAVVPQVFVDIQNQSNGDYYTVASRTLSGCVITCLNAGSPVARNVDIRVEGW